MFGYLNLLIRNELVAVNVIKTKYDNKFPSLDAIESEDTGKESGICLAKSDYSFITNSEIIEDFATFYSDYILKNKEKVNLKIASCILDYIIDPTEIELKGYRTICTTLMQIYRNKYPSEKTPSDQIFHRHIKNMKTIAKEFSKL